MAWSLVQSSEGTSASATVTPTFSVAPTSGNLVILAFCSDDYNASPNAGWTQSAEMEQQTFCGGYIWWQQSTGSQPPSYTIGSAANSAWVLMEFSGGDPAPYDISQGTFLQSTGTTMATDVIVPSTGQRLLVAAIGGSKATQSVPITAWTNSFIAIQDIASAGSGTNDIVGTGYRVVTGDGVTSFSTGITYDTEQSRTALIISFKEAAAAAEVMPNVTMSPMTGV